jgi:hypothetical protein
MVEFEQILPEVGTIFKCVVHLNGLPYEITAWREAEIELEGGQAAGRARPGIRTLG